MKTRGFLFVVLFFIMGVSSFADDVFWAGMGVAIIKDDTMQFFEHNGSSWVRNPSIDINL